MQIANTGVLKHYLLKYNIHLTHSRLLLFMFEYLTINTYY